MRLQKKVRWYIAHGRCDTCGERAIARATNPDDARLFLSHSHGKDAHHALRGTIAILAIVLFSHELKVEPA